VRQLQFLKICSSDTYPGLQDVESLLEKGVDVNFVKCPQGWTPLLMLAEKKGWR
jgi:hypothetical protein